MENSEITKDYFYKKRVIIHQNKKGYRFSVDAPILANFLPMVPNQQALEIGVGSGIVTLLALYKKKFAKVFGVEIQQGLSQLAKLNAEENGFKDNFRIINGDFNQLFPIFRGVQTIFSNPPYFETTRGRLSPNEEIRDAKTETKLNLQQLVSNSFSILGDGGNLFLILPYSRFNEVMNISENIGFFVARERMILSFPHGKPERFLVQLSNYKVSPVTEPPLIIFREKGLYTEEMDEILTG